jgi:hypothetical protein
VLRAYKELAKPAEHLYRELQFGLRAAVGTRSLDELLENKTVIDEVVTAQVKSKLADYGLQLDGVGVKDIVLPGEMKTILAQVVEAGKSAEANVIRRREETGSDALAAEHRQGDGGQPRRPAAERALFLPVVRDMVDEAADQRVRNQSRCRDALVNDLRIDRLLHQHLTAFAGLFAAHMPVHENSAGMMSRRSLMSSPMRTICRPQPGVVQWVSSGSWR